MVTRKSSGSKIATTVILAVLLIMALLGSDVSKLDSVNIASPIWLPVGGIILLWIVVSSFWKNRSVAMGYLASVVLGGYIVFSLILARPFAESGGYGLPTGRASIKMVVFNAKKDNQSASYAAQWIAAQSPDFVILLEADERGSDIPRLLLADLPHQYDCRGDGGCSTMLLSRRPAKSVRYHARGDTENRKTLSALTANIAIEGRAISVTAVHLPRPWPLGDPRKYMSELAGSTDIFDGARITAGDFNNAPWTFAMQGLAHDMRLRLASGAISTWPTGFAIGTILPLDQIYLGNCIKAVSVSAGPDLGSDHLPVVADLQIEDCNA